VQQGGTHASGRVAAFPCSASRRAPHLHQAQRVQHSPQAPGVLMHAVEKAQRGGAAAGQQLALAARRRVQGAHQKQSCARAPSRAARAQA
jgi:hypothetical protein